MITHVSLGYHVIDPVVAFYVDGEAKESDGGAASYASDWNVHFYNI